jgi:hypothetical protein
MTEQSTPPGPDEAPEGRDTSSSDDRPAAEGEPTHTGVPGVDAVLAEIDDLDERPLDQHLGAFERAHDSLRSALDEPADDPA